MSQHDMIIDNAVGATVRTDINAALAALVSNNSGPTEPAVMYAYMLWEDTSTTPKVIKQRNSTNTAWEGVSIAPATAAAHAVRLDQMPQFPFRNPVINSDKSVNQINGATAITPTASAFVTDQWKFVTTQASKLTFQQVADAPAGLKYSTKISVASQFSPGVGDVFLLQQNIEGQNIIDFQLGTAGAATIITSQWIKGSVAGTYSVSIHNGVNDRSYIGTVSVTTSWQRLAISLVGDTAGTWVTDNTSGFLLVYDLGSGSNSNSTAGSWQAAGGLYRTAGSVTFVNQVNGSTLNITGVQVEAVPTGATTPTAFEFLPYETQLRRAQRYLPAFNATGATQFVGSGALYSTSAAVIKFKFKVNPRVVPNGVFASTASGFTLGNGGSIVNSVCTSITISAGTSMEEGSLAVVGTGTPYTAQQPAEMFANSATAQLYFTGAQL